MGKFKRMRRRFFGKSKRSRGKSSSGASPLKAVLFG